ncbi:MAG TPA: chemotaxis protein CheW [Caulobacteraceae bacterium]|nr:chemotaxis protein CheW [Caulobacteraceae bacterium]
MDMAINDNGLEVLTFGLEDEIFALEASCVREILDVTTITTVPGAQPFVSGLLNVRGRVTPLADLKLKFGMEPRPPTVDSRLVVIEVPIEGEPLSVAIRADKVFEVTSLPAASLEAAPAIGMRWRPDYIRCIGKRAADAIVVLDIERVFSTDPNEDNAGGRRAHDRGPRQPVPAAQQEN